MEQNQKKCACEHRLASSGFVCICFGQVSKVERFGDRKSAQAGCEMRREREKERKRDSERVWYRASDDDDNNQKHTVAQPTDNQIKWNFLWIAVNKIWFCFIHCSTFVDRFSLATMGARMLLDDDEVIRVNAKSNRSSLASGCSPRHRNNFKSTFCIEVHMQVAQIMLAFYTDNSLALSWPCKDFFANFLDRWCRQQNSQQILIQYLFNIWIIQNNKNDTKLKTISIEIFVHFLSFNWKFSSTICKLNKTQTQRIFFENIFSDSCCPSSFSLSYSHSHALRHSLYASLLFNEYDQFNAKQSKRDDKNRSENRYYLVNVEILNVFACTGFLSTCRLRSIHHAMSMGMAWYGKPF